MLPPWANYTKLSDRHGALQGLYLDTERNGYQSLHTGLLGPQNHRIEVQIRTPEMRVAEHGVAAHWQYKDGQLGVRSSSNGAGAVGLLDEEAGADEFWSMRWTCIATRSSAHRG